VWAIFTPETVEHEDFMLGFMVRRGYTPLFMPMPQRRYQDAAFKIVRYQQAPSVTEDLVIFDETISLQAWKLINGEDASACDTVTLESWWIAYDVPAANYSATLLLADANNEKIVNTDGSPAGIEMMVWEPNLLYSDTRSLTLPCDLPPGDYSLQLGLYNFETFADLPITGGTEAEADTTRAILTTIHIE
jgi:hypothetical protein